jgi:hypothetical protein
MESPLEYAQLNYRSRVSLRRARFMKAQSSQSRFDMKKVMHLFDKN